MLPKLVATVALVALVLAGCDAEDANVTGAGLPVNIPASPTTTSGPIVGLVGTMSGDDGWRGTQAYEGVHVAIQVLNRLRADGDPFSLVGNDDGGDPERALELIEELAANERTVGIVYAGPAEGVARAEGILEDAGIPALLVYEDLYSARLLRPHLFQVAPPLLWQARRIASYLLEDRAYRRIGLLAEDSLMGQTAIESLQAGMRDEGGRVAAAVTYPVGDEDLSDELQQLREKKVEAIVFHGGQSASERLFIELDDIDASYIDTASARTVSEKKKKKGKRRRRNEDEGWHPQIAGFDQMLGPAVAGEVSTGTVVTDTYARGAFYLPVPEFEEFRKNFVAWWDDEPLGWQRRSYEATLLIGWAYGNGGDDDDLAEVLETLESERFGGIDVAFGPDDHTSVFQTTVGLWTVPRPGIAVRERGKLPEQMPWVPLSRGFSIDGDRTMVLPQDWEHLFKGRYRIDGPAPTIERARFGVTSRRRDPVH